MAHITNKFKEVSFRRCSLVLSNHTFVCGSLPFFQSSRSSLEGRKSLGIFFSCGSLSLSLRSLCSSSSLLWCCLIDTASNRFVFSLTLTPHLCTYVIPLFVSSFVVLWCCLEASAISRFFSLCTQMIYARSSSLAFLPNSPSPLNFLPLPFKDEQIKFNTLPHQGKSELLPPLPRSRPTQSRPSTHPTHDHNTHTLPPRPRPPPPRPPSLPPPRPRPPWMTWSTARP